MVPAPHHWKKYWHLWCHDVQKTPRAQVSEKHEGPHVGHVQPKENFSKVHHVKAREEHHGSHTRNRKAVKKGDHADAEDDHKAKREALADNVVKSAKARVRGDVALANAVMFGKVWQAERALDPPNAAAINLPLRNTGITPLLAACRYASDKDMPKDVKQGAMVHMLLEHKADVTFKDNDGANAMMHALHAGSLPAAMALEGLIDITEEDETGRTVLMFAAMSNIVSVCSFALDRCMMTQGQKAERRSWLITTDKRGWTVAHHAAQCGATDALRWIDARHPDLLTMKFKNPEKPDKLVISPLTLALMERHFDTAEMLMRKGLEVPQHEYEKHVPEEARTYLSDKIKLEKDVGPLIERLTEAASKHHCKQLTEQVDIFKQHQHRWDSDGNMDNLKASALHSLACTADKLMDLEFEVAVVNLRDKQGQTALLRAVKNEEKMKGMVSTVKLLIQYRACAACLDDEGMSPTLIAARSLHQESAKVLKLLYSTAGVEVFVDDHDALGRTALMLAGQVPDAALALEKTQLAVHHFPHKSAEECVTVRCAHGYCALHYGAIGGHAEVVKYLIKKFKEFGVSINTQSFLGTTPLHLAAQFGSPSICQTLQGANADTDLKDRHGYGLRDYMQAGVRDKMSTEKEQNQLVKWCDSSNISASSSSSLPEPASPTLTGRAVGAPRLLSATSNAGLSLAIIKAKHTLQNAAAVERSKSQVLEPQNKKIVDSRVWQCQVCSFQNTPQRQNCACCDSDRAAEGTRKSHHGAIDGVGTVKGKMLKIPLCNESSLMFKVEIFKGKEVLHVYCNGELETRISKVIMNWDTGHVTDIGVELGADDHLTEAEFHMLPGGKDQHLFDLWRLASAVHGVKVVSHGDPHRNIFYDEHHKATQNHHSVKIGEFAPARKQGK
eukprot:gnl/MRDRNA2_/MRDRNA2_113246_c0_seq1.p1 gnl/MRDRNA2_/MRDRNA2_113246_c0~~gnl/MRDRNA2_/MRDRNA2_113246_c0_seq1.p1  ORF type:complete len:897 (+),score=188.34 gnl/MRDRNA2_/MRDRNA2_113246_c0_seq1:187-2877(+)